MPLGEISCIFFSEFHPTAGPKIVYQVSEQSFPVKCKGCAAAVLVFIPFCDGKP